MKANKKPRSTKSKPGIETGLNELVFGNETPEIEGFESLEPIGEGGMGSVYRAKNSMTGHDVAIKTIHIYLGFAPESRKRFREECRILSSLAIHPNVVHLQHAAEYTRSDGGRSPFLVMEFVNGRTLKQHLAKGPLSRKVARKLGIHICRGIGHLHRANIVHRDIKPANIMLTKKAAKITDLGIAKDLSRTSAITGTGQLAPSTESYVAPEVAAGKAGDHRSDVYCIGLVVFEMVTGKRFCDCETDWQREPGIDAEWKSVIGRAVARKPDDRYENVGELGTAISTIAPVVEPRSKRSVVLIFLLVAALAGGGYWLRLDPDLVSRWGISTPATKVSKVEPTTNEVTQQSTSDDGDKLVSVRTKADVSDQDKPNESATDKATKKDEEKLPSGLVAGVKDKFDSLTSGSQQDTPELDETSSKKDTEKSLWSRIKGRFSAGD